METSGWIFMIFSWGVIIVLTFYCFYKVAVSEKQKHKKRKEEQLINYQLEKN